MHFTLSQAAKEARVSKSTLSKALHSGRLSGQRLEDGSFRIDAAELFRVFPRKPPEQPFTNDSETVREQGKNAGEPLETEVLLLRLKVKMLEEQVVREREIAVQVREWSGRERDSHQDTVDDLRKRLDRAEERVLALTIERNASPVIVRPAAAEQIGTPPLEAPQVQRGFLSRLFWRR